MSVAGFLSFCLSGFVFSFIETRAALSCFGSALSLSLLKELAPDSASY